MVGKTLADALPGLFQAEADGLDVLAGTGHVATPRVLAVTRQLLLLKAPPADRDDSEDAWEAFADDMAALHRSTEDQVRLAPRRLPGPARQVNVWTANGHEFFARNRLLRYLAEPLAEQALTAADRRAVERLCTRLPEVIPAMPAVLTHGDMWAANLVSRPGGRPGRCATRSSTRPSPAPGPRSTCPCCGARAALRPPSGSSLAIRNSTPHRPVGPTAYPCSICASNSA